MDECSSKRYEGRLVASRKTTSLVSRNMTNNSKQNVQFCNRIGCSGRLKYSNTTQDRLSEKQKYSRPSFRSSNGKEAIGSSSRIDMRKLNKSSQNKISSLETDSSESSSAQGDADIPEIVPSTSRNEKRFQTETREGSANKVSLLEVGSPRAVSEEKPVRISRRKPVSGCQNIQPGLSVSSTSNTFNSGARSNRQSNRYGLKNLKCNSISDVIPRAGSPSESKVDRKEMKNRSPEGESSSSSRGKRRNGTKFEDGRIPLSTTGISISSPRRIRNPATNSDSTVASGRTRTSLNVNRRMRFSNQDNFSVPLLTESTVSVPDLSPQIHTSVNALLNQSNDTSSSSNDSSHSIIPLTSVEQGVSHALRRYNLDGVAEMLMALERIEQDEELSYEQLLALETNMLLGSLQLYDQHRDMRLDIDNMSYEELLALEERMGTVSTAVPEETLSKCLTITMYQNPSLDLGVDEYGNDEDEIKCSICQEEYVIGDEIGKLACNHGYHVACIEQWLRVKNWCPICKVSVAPSSAPSPS